MSANPDYTALSQQIKAWGGELGFGQVGITDTRLGEARARLDHWLKAGYHGEMGYMQRHGTKRSHPDELIPGTVRVISVRMDYQPVDDNASVQVLESPDLGYLARYSLGRDYHKLMRRRLQKLADCINTEVGAFGYRVFVDSAPVMEKPLAQNAGLGWIGKHTNLINKESGSWFLLGEIYTDLPLPVDEPATDHCGSCHTCMDVCPTNAIIAPYTLDARRCISYLTIELKGSIPVEFRAPIGNRIFGCDDCQLVCPWNKFAKFSAEEDFKPRHQLADAELVDLFLWDEETYLSKTEGSALRRIGYPNWLRNLAIALGNAPRSDRVVSALRSRVDDPSDLVREHVTWALLQHG
jgi:epoxyqueuosine reductase